MPNILLTNDDGIEAEGIRALFDSVSKNPDTNVYVLAPDSNRSGVSSLLTMNSALSFVRRRDLGEGWVSCSGSPVDCVICALTSEIFGGVKFDAVFSGINRGANLGTDVVYSGTCAAARQSVLYGTPGIAASVESYDGSWKFGAMAEFCAGNLGKLISLSSENVFVSLNGSSSDNYGGAVFSSLSARDYRDRFSFPEGVSGDSFSGLLEGGDIRSSERSESLESDFLASFGGKVSVTRIFAEPVWLDERGAKF